MIRSLIRKRGQSTLEYAILIVVVIMALIGIQSYLKRGISGRMKDSADQIGDQFAPQAFTYNYTTYSGGNITESASGGASSTRYQGQWQSRVGSESTGNYSTDFWE